MIYLFAGPTIAHDEVKRQLDCVCLPPVCHMDILGVIEKKPTAIGIIDGYFEGAPSVWHKEILYAMDQGIHVFGSSSMGALRAAELHRFGMQGIGQIFEWYVSGEIEDDDEVAVLHGPPETGFMAASEPMVNIRATLRLARDKAIITEQQYNHFIASAKSTFYKNRSWRRVREMAAHVIPDLTVRGVFEKWIDENTVDLKKQDALLLLDRINDHSRSIQAPQETDYYFEWTNVWDGAYSRHHTLEQKRKRLEKNDHVVLDQLCLNPQQFSRYQDLALLIWACDNDIDVDEELDLKLALKNFRRKNNLRNRDALRDFMEKIHFDEEKLAGALKKTAKIERARRQAGDLRAEIVDQLKLDGEYFSLLNQAREKQDALETAGVSTATSEILPIEYLSWHFEYRLGIEIPDRIDDYIVNIHVQNSADFYRIIHNDYLYYCLQKIINEQ